MAEVLPRDVLLRIGGRTLHRTGVLAAMGTARGYVEVKETFARASTRRFRDRDVANGTVVLGRKANNDKIALEYPASHSALVDAQGLPYCGPLLHSARAQLVTDPENFIAWTEQGTCGLTAGKPDPFGGTNAVLFDSNTPSAADARYQVVPFTGDGAKAIGVFAQQDNAPTSDILLFDQTAAVERCRVRLTWNAGVPVAAIQNGAGTIFPVENWGAGWWRILFAANAIVAANTNRLFLYADPTATGAHTIYFGANAWNSPFPSPYQGPGESPSVADALTLPLNGGPIDLTFLARVARPNHADLVAVDLGLNPRVFSIGPTAPGVGGNIRLGFLQAPSGSNRLTIDTPTTDQNADQAIAAGTEIKLCGQVRLLTTGGKAKLDVGAGFGAETLAASAISAFSSQTLYVGSDDTASNRLSGVLFDLIFARGQRTLVEMLAIP
jgi:hypothetical protein